MLSVELTHQLKEQPCDRYLSNKIRCSFIDPPPGRNVQVCVGVSWHHSHATLCQMQFGSPTNSRKRRWDEPLKCCRFKFLFVSLNGRLSEQQSFQWIFMFTKKLCVCVPEPEKAAGSLRLTIKRHRLTFRHSSFILICLHLSDI